MKTSVSLTLQMDSVFSPFKACEFDAGLDWAKNCGFDGVELIINEPEKVNLQELKEKLSARGLAIATIATGQMISDGLMFCHESESVRNKAVERILQHIDLSTKLGNPNVTIGLARGKGSQEKDVLNKQLEYAANCIERCAMYGNEKNVVINLEPINRYETYMLNSCSETIEIIKKVNYPNVGLLYDTFHSNIEDADMIETIQKFGKNIVHVHFADSNRRVPGEGHINYPEIVSMLKHVGYSGFVSLEVLNIPNAQHVREHAISINKLVRA